MYTGRYDRSEKLYHSDVYLGQDYSDGIQHFKYIKREKVNGKWVYYYKDDLTKKAEKNYNDKLNKHFVDVGYGSNYQMKLDNAKKDAKKYGKISGKSAKKALKTKWYEFDKRNTLKEESDFASGVAKKSKKDIKKYEEKVKKNKEHQAKSLMDVEVAESLYNKAKRKDKAKKFLSKLLVKGLNKAEDIKEDVNKLKKKGIKGVAKDVDNAIDRTTDNVKKGVKKTVKKVKKEIIENVNDIKEAGKELKSDIVSSNKYAEARIRNEKTYIDGNGRIRLTEATKKLKEKVPGGGLKKNPDGSYSPTKAGMKKMKEYSALIDEEDRINEEYKKKKNKKK
jgi:hypothetical protein